jgi:hypothetical protein
MDLGTSQIVGTITSQTPTEIVATFGFGGANFGNWTLNGTRADGLCSGPDPFENAFALLNGDNLLLNGDFEVDGPCGEKDIDGNDFGDCQLDPPPNPGETVTGWFGGFNGHYPKLNGSTHLVDPRTQSGDNRGSIDGRYGGRAYQTRLVLPDKPLQLSGCFIGRAGPQPVIYDHWIRLLDGDQTSTTVLGQYAQQSGGDWFHIDVTGLVPATATVTVEWGFDSTDTSWVDAVATHVDDLVLIQLPAICGDPKMDIDTDGDVDQDDFGGYQACYTGTNGGVPVEPAYCFCLDADDDGDIDQADLTAFEACASGAEIAANPACDG